MYIFTSKHIVGYPRLIHSVTLQHLQNGSTVGIQRCSKRCKRPLTVVNSAIPSRIGGFVAFVRNYAIVFNTTGFAYKASTPTTTRTL
ncbi:hypothetical protein DPMN_100607 [Dreissena polymorpha]|uniref:Uncharacterized protein n=1 Tax=Dreissena polymorpha TaxID=45954 RepID=A0A9D4LHV0_DREPO|nr:hypothetical protein DPMN_100607 [Dreissena polymorpha]